MKLHRHFLLVYLDGINISGMLLQGCAPLWMLITLTFKTSSRPTNVGVVSTLLILPKPNYLISLIFSDVNLGSLLHIKTHTHSSPPSELHPNIKGQAKMAGIVPSVIRAVLHWS
jgi:hypothetical protein